MGTSKFLPSSAFIILPWSLNIRGAKNELGSRGMKTSNGIKGRDALAIDIDGLTTRKSRHLSAPAEAVEIQLGHTAITKELCKVNKSRQDGRRVRLGLEESLHVLLCANVNGAELVNRIPCTLCSSVLGGC
jgi:hypothetical protein